MRHALIGLLIMGATAVASPANAQLSVSLGFNVPAYPNLVQIPSYPVYYAPSLPENYFFYDGFYWVFANGTWYQSTWYNGPWVAVDPYSVPVYLLRVPVRYYHARPAYFRGWAADQPPHWGEHYGSSWSSRRSGWDHWSRSSAPAAAPLPTYQRSYSGNHYPRDRTLQTSIQGQHVASGAQTRTQAATHSTAVTPAKAGAQTRPQAATQTRAAPQQAPSQHQEQARQRTQRTEQARSQPQQHVQQAQVEHGQPARASQPQRAEPQRQAQARVEHAQPQQQRPQQAQAQPQRQEHVQQAQRSEQPQRAPQHENRGQDKNNQNERG